MLSRIGGIAMLSAVLGLTGACATSEEWNDWLSHPTHFASDQHLGFSLRNDVGGRPRVLRSDIELAKTQNWWGRIISVNPDQIFQD
ncbi:MAG: hypothetical protein L0027_07615 [Candidatus Rokubacteria bacterium]|nr:hypothetical protein [Candidatus Rokubacteria bacterium]